MTPEQVDKLITYGQMALEQGWYDKARGYFEQALELDANNEIAKQAIAQIDEMLRPKPPFRVSWAEETQAEEPASMPAEPPHEVEQERSISKKKREGQGRSLTQWFKRQSRLRKIGVLAGVALLFLCFYVGFASVISPELPTSAPRPTATPTLIPYEEAYEEALEEAKLSFEQGVEELTRFLLTVLVIAAFLGLIPAVIAYQKGKGRSVFVWWVFGWALFIVALPAAILLKPDVAELERRQLKQGTVKRCPYCAELVKREARVCRHCGRDMTMPPEP